MTAELKPCPFCGGVAVHSTWEAYSTDSSFDCIKCSVCTVMMPCERPRWSFNERKWVDSGSDDIAEWNRRADLSPTLAHALPLPEIAALVEALNLACEALQEAEAILGGEYGDHYGPFCNLMIALQSKASAALAKLTP